MPDTFAGLLADLLRHEPGRPLVTYYDAATGERTELSVTTYANWVAKTSSLLVEELGLERGGSLLVDLPAHWLTPVFVGAAWNVGLCVVRDGVADAVVCGPSGVEVYADGAAPVIACSLLPLGARFAEPLPQGVHDFGLEVWSQPDAFLPWDPVTPDDAALPGLSQSELLHRRAEHVVPGGRLLTSVNLLDDPAVFLEPLVTGGSVVWVANPPDPEWLRATYDAERATVQLVPD
jgi:uncharacterized protein (TIGR03089 family)